MKTLTSDAKNLAKYLDAAAQCEVLRQSNLDVEMALEEAFHLDCLNTTADLVKQATQLEQTTAKLYTTWKRLGTLADRLYVDTGASNPHLRSRSGALLSLLSCLSSLTGETFEVALDDGGEKVVRLKLMTD